MNTTALGRKFQNFELSSPMASFDAFEQREREKRGRALWFELSLLFLAVVLTLVLLGKGSYFRFSGSTQTDHQEMSSPLAKGSEGVILNSEAPSSTNESSLPIMDSEEDQASEPKNDRLQEKASARAEESDPQQQTKVRNQDETPSVDNVESPNPAPNDEQFYFDAGLIKKLDVFSLMAWRMEQMHTDIQEQWNESVQKEHREFLKDHPLESNISPFRDIRLELSFGVNVSDYGISSSSDADTYVHMNYGEWTQASMNKAVLPFANLDISLPVTQDLRFRTGFNFRQSGAAMNYDITVNQVPVYGFDGKISGYIEDSANSYQASSVQKISYFSLPLGMDYTFHKRSVYGFFGLQADLGLVRKVSGQTLDPFNVKNAIDLDANDFSKFNLGGTFRFGLGMPLNKTTRVGFVLSYHQGFTPNLSNGYYNFTNRGIGIGLHMSFELPRQWK